MISSEDRNPLVFRLPNSRLVVRLFRSIPRRFEKRVLIQTDFGFAEHRK